MAEESISSQIAAMEGWAIQAQERIKGRDFKGAEEALKTLNIQGRRLEWRGGELGLRSLPKTPESTQIKTNISSARAAAANAISSINELLSLASKIKTESGAEAQLIERRVSEHINDATKNIAILVRLLIDSKRLFRNSFIAPSAVFSDADKLFADARANWKPLNLS
jgi:hypothetical protein